MHDSVGWQFDVGAPGQVFGGQSWLSQQMGQLRTLQEGFHLSDVAGVSWEVTGLCL